VAAVVVHGLLVRVEQAAQVVVVLVETWVEQEQAAMEPLTRAVVAVEVLVVVDLLLDQAALASSS